MRECLKKDVEQMKLKDPNFSPGLVVLQVSIWWISNIVKAHRCIKQMFSWSIRTLCNVPLFCRRVIIVSLQVGDRDDSNLYISMKLKAAKEVKLCIYCLHTLFPFLGLNLELFVSF